jgi:mediator of RNA polymerase II transcription subunit 4
MADSNSTALLLNVLEDAEQASKQIKRYMVSSDLTAISDVKSNSADQLIEGILERDKEIKRLMSIVQAERQNQKKCDETRAIIVQKTKELKQLQTHLREAEKILEQSLYEARQKLDGIKRASNGIISSEELIVYGHKLSMANITSPPVDWMPGDSRRPYPTDIEMRCGSLSRLNRDTSSDRVSEVSKPDVSMETDQPLQGVQ